MLPVWCRLWGLFLSTPSARRATRPRRPAHSCGSISIHALREEGDLIAKVLAGRCAIFLSTPSARRATQASTCRSKSIAISIHALREEGDQAFVIDKLAQDYFYPRPPRGGRPPSIGGLF